MLRPYEDQDFPKRHRAPMPADRLAAVPWLIVGQLAGTIVTPFPRRIAGLTEAERQSILAVRRLLKFTTYWFDPRDGRLTIQQDMSPDAIRTRAAAHVAVKLGRG